MKSVMAGETVHAKHILVDDEDKCQEILEKIIGEETTFEDAAKEIFNMPIQRKRWRPWCIWTRTDGERI